MNGCNIFLLVINNNVMAVFVTITTILFLFAYSLFLWLEHCPLGWGRRIHRLHFCRGVKTAPMSDLDMKLKTLMVRFQICKSLGDNGAPFHCHCSQINFDKIQSMG